MSSSLECMASWSDSFLLLVDRLWKVESRGHKSYSKTKVQKNILGTAKSESFLRAQKYDRKKCLRGQVVWNLL